MADVHAEFRAARKRGTLSALMATQARRLAMGNRDRQKREEKKPKQPKKPAPKIRAGSA